MIEPVPEPGPLGAVSIVLNPAAGRGGARQARIRLEDELSRRGIRFALHVTSASGDAVSLAEREALAGTAVIVACGGDGTVNEVATGLLRARERDASVRAALAVVPVGTGNDFAKLLGTTGSFDAAVEAIVNGPVRLFDSGIAEWVGGEARFVNAFGTGIDVEVVRQIRQQSLPGTLTYFVGLARALVRYRAIPIRLRTNERTIESRVMMIAIANGRYVGGSFNICPAALPDDGAFDVCVIREVSLAATPRLAARIVRGTHAGHPAVEFLRTSAAEVEVTGGAPLFFQADGELYEPPEARSVRVRLLPATLPVRVAPRNRGQPAE
ncbi:MAG: diacylglycerol/lipid kinase family protein [Longimicrobiales bacterium]